MFWPVLNYYLICCTDLLFEQQILITPNQTISSLQVYINEDTANQRVSHMIVAKIAEYVYAQHLHLKLLLEGKS